MSSELYPDPLYVEADTEKRHRYALAYVVSPLPVSRIIELDQVLVIMQNPSWAGVRQPHDNTTQELIRRLRGTGEFGVLSIVNLDPTVGAKLPFTTLSANAAWALNEPHVEREVARADCVVCAWTTGEPQRRFARDFILPILRRHNKPLAVFSENGMPYHPKPRKKNENLASVLHHITETELSLV